MIDSTALIGLGTVVLLALLVLGTGFLKFKPKPLKQAYYIQHWERITNLYGGDRTTWPLAVINADKLLDNALKARRVRGKTMGERLVAAQKRLTNNDAVWFAHKLRNKLVHESDSVSLREKDVSQALDGIKRALKDMGALPR